jgi:hypothetical protein
MSDELLAFATALERTVADYGVLAGYQTLTHRATCAMKRGGVNCSCGLDGAVAELNHAKAALDRAQTVYRATL